MQTQTLALIGALLVLLFAVLVIYVILKKGSKKKSNAAEKFLDEFENTIYDTCKDIIDNYNFNSGASLEQIETDILSIIYEKIWGFIENYLKENKSLVTDFILKVITKDAVINYTDKLLRRSGLSRRIEDLYAASFIEANSDNMVEEDKKLEKEFSDSDKFIENSDDIELPKPEPTVLSDEQQSKINPPKDEVSYDEENDPSVELLPEPKIILQRDKNGNALYFSIDEEGKKKRVTKQYVKESGIVPVEEK